MGALQFHQAPQKFMTPISFSCNLRAATTTTTLCLRSIFSNCLSIACPKLCTPKINAISKGSADELKEQWLNSLNCPPIQNDGEPVSNNVDSQWIIGVDPDVSGALAVLKTCQCSAQVYDSPNVKVLIGNRIRRRMDTKAIVELLRSLSIPVGTTAYIEQSLPYPGDGKQGWWSGGFNYGLWIGILVASGVSVVPVPSMRWKQEFKLSGNGKTKAGLRLCSLLHTAKA